MSISRANLPAYAGIGSRQTPWPVLALMGQIGQALARAGWVLRSGNCPGADQAFAQGANAVDHGLVQLCLPWNGYEAKAIQSGNIVYTPDSQAFALAARSHPAWSRCSQGAKAMHARNTQIILGPNLAQPVSLVICWTHGGKERGGTGQGIRLAKAYALPVVSLARPDGWEAVGGILAKVSPGHVQSSLASPEPGRQMEFDF